MMQSQPSSQPVPPAIAPGCLLNQRYQVEQLLGRGGFSQTYRVRDLHKPSHPVCVVKHLQPASREPQYLQTAHTLFEAEAISLECLGHHGQIPALLAYFEEQQQYYLVQEYVEGPLLSAELPQGCQWTASQVLALLCDVLSILEFVHGHGIVHRDLKPDNLIRREDGQLVLIDFGSVKQLRTPTNPDQAHQNATIAIGTKGYIAPEQGQGNPSPRSDLYSLGVIAIRALTGMDPSQFQHDPDTGEICWQAPAGVSPDLVQIIQRLAAFHFRDRYASATEALAAVRVCMESGSLGAPVLIVPPPPAAPAQPPAPVAAPPATVPPVSPSFLAATAVPPMPLSPTFDNPASAQNKAWVKHGLGTGIAATTLLTIGICSLPTTTNQTPQKPGSTATKAEQTQRKVSLARDRQPVTAPRPAAVPMPSVLPAPALPPSRPLAAPPPPAPPVQPVAKPAIAAQPPQASPVEQRQTGQPQPSLAQASQKQPERLTPPAASTAVQFEIYAQARIPVMTDSGPTDELMASLNTQAPMPMPETIVASEDALIVPEPPPETPVAPPDTPPPLTTTPTPPAAISPDGQYLVGISPDNVVKVWNLQTGELLHFFQVPSTPVKTIVVSDDSHTLTTVNLQGVTESWDLHTGQPISSL